MLVDVQCARFLNIELMPSTTQQMAKRRSETNFAGFDARKKKTICLFAKRNRGKSRGCYVRFDAVVRAAVLRYLVVSFAYCAFLMSVFINFRKTISTFLL